MPMIPMNIIIKCHTVPVLVEVWYLLDMYWKGMCTCLQFDLYLCLFDNFTQSPHCIYNMKSYVLYT